MIGVSVAGDETNLTDMAVSASTDAVKATSQTGIKITRCLLFSTSGNGLDLTSCQNVAVVDTVVSADSTPPTASLDDCWNVRIVGCQFAGTSTGLLIADGGTTTITGCTFPSGTIGVGSGGSFVDSVSIVGCEFEDITTAVALINGTGCIVADNMMVVLTGDVITLEDTSRCKVDGNMITYPGGGFDGILLSGDSNYNRVANNQVVSRPSSHAQYAVNVSASTCDCNVVVANSGSDPADFTGDAINDAGTQTWLTFPADPTYGDNMFGCPPTS